MYTGIGWVLPLLGTCPGKFRPLKMSLRGLASTVGHCHHCPTAPQPHFLALLCVHRDGSRQQLSFATGFKMALSVERTGRSLQNCNGRGFLFWLCCAVFPASDRSACKSPRSAHLCVLHGSPVPRTLQEIPPSQRDRPALPMSWSKYLPPRGSRAFPRTLGLGLFPFFSLSLTIPFYSSSERRTLY